VSRKSSAWFAVLTIEQEEEKSATNHYSEVGIAFGLMKLAVVSDGTKIFTPK